MRELDLAGCLLAIPTLQQPRVHPARPTYQASAAKPSDSEVSTVASRSWPARNEFVVATSATTRATSGHALGRQTASEVTEHRARLAANESRATPVADSALGGDARAHAKQAHSRADLGRGRGARTRPVDTETPKPRRARSGRQTRPDDNPRGPHSQAARPQSPTLAVALLEPRHTAVARRERTRRRSPPARDPYPTTTSR